MTGSAELNTKLSSVHDERLRSRCFAQYLSAVVIQEFLGRATRGIDQSRQKNPSHPIQPRTTTCPVSPSFSFARQIYIYIYIPKRRGAGSRLCGGGEWFGGVCGQDKGGRCRIQMARIARGIGHDISPVINALLLDRENKVRQSTTPKRRHGRDHSAQRGATTCTAAKRPRDSSPI